MFFITHPRILVVREWILLSVSGLLGSYSADSLVVGLWVLLPRDILLESLN